jgi:hypothetical protein
MTSGIAPVPASHLSNDNRFEFAESPGTVYIRYGNRAIAEANAYAPYIRDNRLVNPLPSTNPPRLSLRPSRRRLELLILSQLAQNLFSRQPQSNEWPWSPVSQLAPRVTLTNFRKAMAHLQVIKLVDHVHGLGYCLTGAGLLRAAAEGLVEYTRRFEEDS